MKLWLNDEAQLAVRERLRGLLETFNHPTFHLTFNSEIQLANVAEPKKIGDIDQMTTELHIVGYAVDRRRAYVRTAKTALWAPVPYRFRRPGGKPVVVLDPIWGILAGERWYRKDTAVAPDQYHRGGPLGEPLVVSAKVQISS